MVFKMVQTETKRMVWIIGLMVSLVIVFQYFELQYGNALPSLSILQTGVSTHYSKFRGNTVNQNKTMKPKNLENVDLGLPLEEATYNNSSSIGRVGTPVAGFPSLSPETPPANSSLYTTPIIVLDSNISSPIIFVDTNLEENRTITSEEKKKLEPIHNDLKNSPVIPLASSIVLDSNIRTPAISANSNTSLVKKNRTIISPEKKKWDPVHSDLSQMDKNSPMNKVSKRNHSSKVPVSNAYSLSKMNNLLLQGRASYYSMIPKWSSAVDNELQGVTSQVENAPIVQNDPNLYAPLYRNVSIFKRSYELMEQTLKVYIYKEGERPMLHKPILYGIYASEGWFMKQLEANEQFVTKDPQKAHMFYLPFSSLMLRKKLPNSRGYSSIEQYLKNYLDQIASKYPFWNRTEGADHFLAACHDWAPKETSRYMSKCIRALCNANAKRGFVFGKDVSLPTTYVYLSNDTLRGLGGKPVSERSTLAFFAGSMHGYLRPILLEHWKNKDPDMKIFGKLPKTNDNEIYTNYMKSSKYCISAKGFEVYTPRVVEAIFYECVPVIISDNYVPPFFDVLNWESFAVFVLQKDIPNLKKILLSIPEKRYQEMHMMVKRVQQHFLWRAKPVKYDIFHMILHSIWYNRLHQIRPI